MLGDLLALHPETAYLFEPFALWAAVDARTDVGHVYTDAAVGIVLDEDDWSPEAQSRFDRLFATTGSGKAQVIEKSPRNTMRIGYLRRLAPGCRFVHIVRSGPEVARSIARFADRNADDPRRQRLQRNSWWGVGDAKWKAICFDAARFDMLPSDLPSYRDNQVRGACEWLMSLEAIERAKATISSDLLEIRYQDITSAPRDALADIAGFLQLDVDAAWIEAAERLIRPSTATHVGPLQLPVALAEGVNAWQDRYGFDERAVAVPTPSS
jgi:hypothetical protein